MNQDNYYAPGRLYDTQTGNIKSINNQLVFEEQLVLDVLPESTDNTYGLVVDEANQVFKQVIEEPGTGDVVGPSVSFENGIASYLDTSGKSIISKNGPTISKLSTSHGYESIIYRGDGAHLSKKSIGFNMVYPPDPALVIPAHGINTSTFTTDTSALISYGYGCFLNGSQTMISNWTQPTIYSSNFVNGEFSLKKRDNCLPFTGYDYNSDFDTIWQMSPNVDNIRYQTEIVANGGLISKITNDFDDSTTTFLNSNVDFTAANVIGLPGGNVSSGLSTMNSLCKYSDTSGENIEPSDVFYDSNSSELLVNANAMNSSLSLVNSEGNRAIQLIAFENSQIFTFGGYFNQLFNFISSMDAGKLCFYWINDFGNWKMRVGTSLGDGVAIPFGNFTEYLRYNIFGVQYLVETSFVSLVSTATNNFSNSNTSFVNSVINFTGANVSGLPFVEGPVSSVDNGVCTFNGTDGSAIQTTNVQIIGTTMNVNGDLNAATIGANDINTIGLTLGFGGVLDSQTTNNFQTSITDFSNSTIDFDNAIINNFDRVQFVGTSPVLGQLPYYDDNTGQKINNSGILVNGVNDLTNINGLSCTGINTGQGLVECYQMDQPVRTTDNVSFNTIDNNRIKPQQIAKVGIVDVSDPNRITLETDNAGVGLPWEVWSLGDNKDDTYMGFDVSSGGGLNNFKLNSDNQILYHKTDQGLEIYGGNKLKANGNIQITGLNKLLTYGTNGIDFHTQCDFDSGVVTYGQVRFNNLLEVPTNTRFLTLDATNYLETKTIIPVYGGMYFENNLTNTVITVQNQFFLFGSLFNNLPDFTGISFPTQAITMLEDCKLDLNCSVSLESQSATFIQYEFCLFKNGVAIPGSCRRTSTTDNNEDKNLECSSIVSVLTNDVLDVRVRNITNTTDILITNCCFKVVRIFE